jgi:hypothetical protein
MDIPMTKLQGETDRGSTRFSKRTDQDEAMAEIPPNPTHAVPRSKLFEDPCYDICLKPGNGTVNVCFGRFLVKPLPDRTSSL